MKRSNGIAASALVLAACLTAGFAAAQPAPPSLAGKRFVSPTGVELHVLVDQGKLGGTEAEVAELTFPPNSDSGDHKHAVTETFYLLEGELDQVINGKSNPLTPGMAVSIRSTDQVRHKSGAKGAKVLVIWAPGGEVARLASRWKEK